EECPERDFRQGEPARGNRSVHGRSAWLVPSGFAGLQRGTGRKGMEPFACVVRKGSGLSPAETALLKKFAGATPSLAALASPPHKGETNSSLVTNVVSPL